MALDIELTDYNLTGSGAIGVAHHEGRVIGDAELMIAGQSAGILAIFDGRGATFDVRRYRPGERDDLCPDAGKEPYFPVR
jgi:hypothetical protein